VAAAAAAGGMLGAAATAAAAGAAGTGCRAVMTRAARIQGQSDKI